MVYDFLLEFIDHFGYIALFLVLCLGLIGLPIPNEVVVMTAGTLSATGILYYPFAYLAVSLGICSAMTVGYVVGRFFVKTRLFRSMQKTTKTERYFMISEKWFHKYGGFAISMSLCLPFLRHITMYVAGMNRMSYRRFVRYAYPAAFLWTLVFFLLGIVAEDHIAEIGALIEHYGIIIVIVLIVLLFIYLLFRSSRKKQPHKTLSGRK
ncbi:DedA family protein [Paenibacillus sp. Marseille-Q4541]|uniref:DedA family protein n=1 Tax=Paenibacillus sp. Marseille-Q4541 TaxID=2831522 RepID=UPI001BA7B533|nr:DedA family protein [Paenibacillus sp. Marseille-Q4541]